jgi:prolyl oligopeptidase
MLLGLCCALVAGDADVPALPVAPVRVVSDIYHGTKIDDPYRYFENLKDPEVEVWLKGQADHAAAVLQRIPGRDAMLQRMLELNAGAPYLISAEQRRPNGDLYYLKILASESVPKFYIRDGKSGNEKLLIDPARHDISPRERATLAFQEPSPDGKYIAYGIARAGSEATTIYVWDVAAERDLPEVIDRIETAYNVPQWLPDGGGFYYVRRQKLPPSAPATDGYKLSRTFLHRLNSDPESEVLVLAKDASPDVQLADTDFPSITLTHGSQFTVAKITHGDAKELTLYSAPAAMLGQPGIKWTRICTPAEQVSAFAVHEGDIYLLTAHQAPRYKAVRTSLAQPDFEHAAVIVPPSDAVVDSIAAAQDALYVNLLDGGRGVVRRVPYAEGSVAETLKLPIGFSSGRAVAAEPDISGVLLHLSSWTRAMMIQEYDPVIKVITDPGLTALGKFDNVPGYTSTEVMVKSHDGVLVPMSIIHRENLTFDGSHPTLLVGYGAYGSVMHVAYTPVRLAWLERGGILAIAHVRGGGEFGHAWHQAGQKATKPNTWKDFIACAEYLVEHKYTSPKKLAGQGGSAGGILIGRAITERPDLFAAALIDVGCLDTLRMETTTNGVPNIPEFGIVTTKEGFDGLLAMSAYQHVRDGVKYPSILLVHGINDPRVEPWMSAKMAARLQAATASGKPVLLRIDYAGGHGIGSTRTQIFEQRADQNSFLLWQMGVPEFQPK